MPTRRPLNGVRHRHSEDPRRSGRVEGCLRHGTVTMSMPRKPSRERQMQWARVARRWSRIVLVTDHKAVLHAILGASSQKPLHKTRRPGTGAAMQTGSFSLHHLPHVAPVPRPMRFGKLANWSARWDRSWKSMHLTAILPRSGFSMDDERHNHWTGARGVTPPPLHIVNAAVMAVHLTRAQHSRPSTPRTTSS